MGQKNRHSFNYGQTSDAQDIKVPEGYRMLNEGEFVPGKFKQYEEGNGWVDGRLPLTNRARVKDNVRAYAEPRKQR